MTIYVVETHGSRNLDGNERDTNKETSERGYIVTGTEDEYAAYAAVQAAAPSFDVSLIRNTIKLRHIEIDHWEATVQYVVQEREKKDPDIGQIDWDFDTTGGTQHITSGLAPSVIFHDPAWNPMEFQRAIGVSKKKHGYDVKGVDVVVPKLELTATTSFAPNVVTIEWIKAVSEMTGKTNDAVWYTFPEGELLFMGARIKAKYREKTTVTFTFSASETMTAADQIFIGGINGAQGFGPIEKTGHAHMWIYFIQEEEANMVLMKPKQVNVEMIYQEADFLELGIGG
jgi:hypothetical protein